MQSPNRILVPVDFSDPSLAALRYATALGAQLGASVDVLHVWDPPKDIGSPTGLLVEFAKSERAELRQNGIRVNVIGSLEDLPTVTRHAVEDLMAYTKDGERMTLTLALSYGGRKDIVEAARTLAVQARAGLVLPEEIDERSLQLHMTTHRLPDVDLLIRTGGETRVSDFLLFESAYAELLFLPIMWPDFKPQTLHDAIEHYGQKERRFGMTSEQLSKNVQAFDPFDQPS